MCFGEDDAAFAMTNVQDHRIRREIMNPLFSRRAILKLEIFVQEKVLVSHKFLPCYTSNYLCRSTSS